jgi:hypothetical protein
MGRRPVQTSEGSFLWRLVMDPVRWRHLMLVMWLTQVAAFISLFVYIWVRI